jgi:hypothetical protein
MEFIDLLLNYFIGAVFCIITIAIVNTFAQDKKGNKDLVLLQMTLQLFLVPLCIKLLKIPPSSSIVRGPVFAPFVGAIKYQALHYILWILFAYYLDKYDRRRQALKK